MSNLTSSPINLIPKRAVRPKSAAPPSRPRTAREKRPVIELPPLETVGLGGSSTITSGNVGGNGSGAGRRPKSSPAMISLARGKITTEGGGDVRRLEVVEGYKAVEGDNGDAVKPMEGSGGAEEVVVEDVLMAPTVDEQPVEETIDEIASLNSPPTVKSENINYSPLDTIPSHPPKHSSRKQQTEDFTSFDHLSTLLQSSPPQHPKPASPTSTSTRPTTSPARPQKAPEPQIDVAALTQTLHQILHQSRPYLSESSR
ncbi:hypothetical protein HK097_000165, partial [Rhizophlyctis rosea]